MSGSVMQASVAPGASGYQPPAGTTYAGMSTGTSPYAAQAAPTYGAPAASAPAFTYAPATMAGYQQYMQYAPAGVHLTQQQYIMADTNHDGRVSQQEVQAATAQIDPVKQGLIGNHRGLGMYDHFVNQHVVAQNYQQYVTYAHSHGDHQVHLSQQQYQSADTNHDGKLTYAEMLRAGVSQPAPGSVSVPAAGSVSVPATQPAAAPAAAPVAAPVAAPAPYTQPVQTIPYTQPIQSAGSFVAYPQYSYAPGTYTQPAVPYNFTPQQVGFALDTNHDGKVSQAEMKAADTNNDGKLDAAEVTAAAPKVKSSKKKKVSKKKKSGCC